MAIIKGYYMSINVTGIHFKVTENLKQHVHSRIEQIAKNYTLIHANVSLSMVNKQFSCAIEYKGAIYSANADSAVRDDLYVAIAICAEAIKRQLNEQKNKQKKKGQESIKSKALDQIENSDLHQGVELVD